MKATTFASIRDVNKNKIVRQLNSFLCALEEFLNLVTSKILRGYLGHPSSSVWSRRWCFCQAVFLWGISFWRFAAAVMRLLIKLIGFYYAEGTEQPDIICWWCQACLVSFASHISTFLVTYYLLSYCKLTCLSLLTIETNSQEIYFFYDNINMMIILSILKNVKISHLIWCRNFLISINKKKMAKLFSLDSA